MSGKQTHIKVTAYHEAGHAVAALREGRPVGWVAAFRHRLGSGICYFNRRQQTPYNLEINPACAVASWVHTMQSTRSDMRISLAGPLAQAKVLGKPLRLLGSKSDLVKCLNLASRLTRLHSYVSEFAEIAPIDAEKMLNDERLFVRRWLAQPDVWNTVEQVATKLFRLGPISNQFLDELVGIANTPENQGNLIFRKRFGSRKNC